jgi:hypothetical protein
LRDTPNSLTTARHHINGAGKKLSKTLVSFSLSGSLAVCARRAGVAPLFRSTAAAAREISARALLGHEGHYRLHYITPGIERKKSSAPAGISNIEYHLFFHRP